MLQRSLSRTREPDGFPLERVLVGELHLIRGRLDDALRELAVVVERDDAPEEWARVEEATRVARRAVCVALRVAPALAVDVLVQGELSVGRLRVDGSARRQWYGEAEVELTPLQHRLLAVMAAEPLRVFAKDELLRAVWGRPRLERSSTVKTTVSRVRRALVAAGAPPDRFMRSLHGIGWALTSDPRAD